MGGDASWPLVFTDDLRDPECAVLPPEGKQKQRFQDDVRKNELLRRKLEEARNAAVEVAGNQGAGNNNCR